MMHTFRPCQGEWPQSLKAWNAYARLQQLVCLVSYHSLIFHLLAGSHAQISSPPKMICIGYVTA
jgi:hypothetical protein